MKNSSKLILSASTIKKILSQSNNLIDSNCEENGSLSVNNFSPDSRQIEAGDCYIAYSGVSKDGHNYIKAATKNGARCLVVEKIESIPINFTGIYFHVSSGRKAWSWLESEKHDNPSKKIKMIGVTGTNGKSSTVWMIRNLLNQAGIPCLMLGTIGNFLGEEGIASKHTTPDPPEYFRLLNEAVDRGIEFCVMEVASQAVFHNKLGPTKFDVAVFTSFTRDHLDLHGSMEAYFECKAKLFTEHLKNDATSIVSTTVLENAKSDFKPSAPKLIYYGRKSPPTAAIFYSISVNHESMDSTHFELSGPKFRKKLVIESLGGFLVDNFCASIIVLESLGIESKKLEYSSDIVSVPGRLEKVSSNSSSEFAVIVDYAHTPDAALKALSSVKNIATGRILTVFGCGGNRDVGKRPEMASVIEASSDIVYVTSDNPRNENPETILDDIMAGATSQDKWRRIPDRKLAIYTAVSEAKKDDCVIILGKGHEDYQIIGDKILDFDDRIIAKQALLEVSKHV